MNINVKQHFERQCKDALSDEKHFAQRITARYKMSNTRNKEFVNCIILNTKEITTRFNLDTLITEIKALDFHIIKFEENDYIGIVKNNEQRELHFNKIFTIDQFL